MADVVSPMVRSQMMAGIRGKHTKPELQIRSALHSRGFRYRLHSKNLPGRPDIVLPKWQAVIFVHGCFWHGHHCHLYKLPSTRPRFWRNKIEGNKIVDCRASTALAEAGWRIALIWECALKGRTKLPFDDVMEQCVNWLEGGTRRLEIQGRQLLVPRHGLSAS
ncbi:very short patch repair endonuclease [Reyranella sp.]|uniref:very short patch repair endonuclease n=1 Tax=Reyranella sp. TaxID=1929291 RepID=UPI003D0D6AAB